MRTEDATESPIIESSPLSRLHYDLRRMLQVQFKEFIHYIEDTENAFEQHTCIDFGRCAQAKMETVKTERWAANI